MKGCVFRLLSPIYLILLTGCFWDTFTDEKITGKYRVLAIDDAEEFLVFDRSDGYGAHIISKSIYNIKWNDRFMLVLQHPLEVDSNSQELPFAEPDRKKTIYYLIDMVKAPEKPKEFFHLDSLTKYMQQIEVGRLTYEKKY